MKKFENLINEIDFLKAAAIVTVLIIIYAFLGGLIAIFTNYGRYFLVDASTFTVSVYIGLGLYKLMLKPTETDKWITELKDKIEIITPDINYDGNLTEVFGYTANKKSFKLASSIIGLFIIVTFCEFSYNKLQKSVNFNQTNTDIDTLISSNTNLDSLIPNTSANIESEYIDTSFFKSQREDFIKLEMNFKYSQIKNISDSIIKLNNSPEYLEYFYLEQSNKISILFDKISQEQEIEIFHKHRIKSGESLLSIAAKYDVSVLTIKAINKLVSDNIAFGNTLYVPTKVKIFKYSVRSNETLFSIAKVNHIWIYQIKEINNISNEQVFKGQILYLFSIKE